MCVFSTTAGEKPLLYGSTPGQLLHGWTGFSPKRVILGTGAGSDSILWLLVVGQQKENVVFIPRAATLQLGQGLTFVTASCLPMCLVKHLGLHLFFTHLHHIVWCKKHSLCFSLRDTIHCVPNCVWYVWPSAFGLKCSVLETFVIMAVDLIMDG